MLHTNPNVLPDGRIKFSYSGPVYLFGRLYAENFEGETFALTLQKAAQNFAWRAKKQYGFSANTRISVNPDKIKEVI